MTPEDWANEVIAICQTNLINCGVVHTVYESIMDIKIDKRGEAFLDLLRPITWYPSDSIEYRRDMVMARRKQVRFVYPFLTESEQAQADDWLERERHDGLWD
jgi:hypothetical protein